MKALDELKKYPNFVNWELGGDKEPINPHSVTPNQYYRAKSNNKDTWGSFDEALQATRTSEKKLGLGFVFSKDDNFIGIDLDNCFEPGGKLKKWAADIVGQMDSYTEKSPSGNGLHILTKGILVAGNFRKKTKELDGDGHSASNSPVSGLKL